MDFFALNFIIKFLYKISLIVITEGLDIPLNSVPRVSALLSQPQSCRSDLPLVEGYELGEEGEPSLHSRITWEVLKALCGLTSPQTNYIRISGSGAQTRLCF